MALVEDNEAFFTIAAVALEPVLDLQAPSPAQHTMSNERPSSLTNHRLQGLLSYLVAKGLGACLRPGVPAI